MDFVLLSFVTGLLFLLQMCYIQKFIDMKFISLVEICSHIVVVDFVADDLKQAKRYVKDTFCYDKQVCLGVWHYDAYLKRAFDLRVLGSFSDAPYINPGYLH